MVRQHYGGFLFGNLFDEFTINQVRLVYSEKKRERKKGFKVFQRMRCNNTLIVVEVNCGVVFTSLAPDNILYVDKEYFFISADLNFPGNDKII